VPTSYALSRALSFLLASTLLLGCETEAPSPPSHTLLDAAEQGDLVSMDDFLLGSQFVNMRDSCKITPLMRAALNGHTEAVERLLKKGAAIDLVDKGGYSALMLAASNNHFRTVQLLLGWGATVDIVEHTEGLTALIWAARLGHVETVKTLLEHGADPKLRDLQGRDALYHAQQTQNQELVALLQS